MKVYVHPSKNGIGRYVVLTKEGAAFFVPQSMYAEKF